MRLVSVKWLLAGGMFVTCLAPLFAVNEAHAFGWFNWWRRPAAQTQTTFFRPFGGHFSNNQSVVAGTANLAPGQCTQTCVRYVPQTTFRTVQRRVPTTVYRPVTSVDPTTGCRTTCMRPCTTFRIQTQRVPVTTYRPVVTTQRIQAPACPTTTAMPATCDPCNQMSGFAPSCNGACPTASPAAIQRPAPSSLDTIPGPSSSSPADTPPSLSPSQGSGTRGSSSYYQRDPQVRRRYIIPGDSDNGASDSGKNGTSENGKNRNSSLRAIPDLDAQEQDGAYRGPRLTEPRDRTASKPRVRPAVARPIEWPTYKVRKVTASEPIALKAPAERGDSKWDTGGWTSVRGR